jgi:hypothetical protein
MALTQINPALFAGATNTTAVIQSNGTTAITVDSSQKVGIGTTSPNDVLTVGGTAAFIRIDRTADEPGIDMRVSGSNTNKGVIAVTTGGAMYFTTGGNTERMRINAGAPILCLAGGSTTATGTGIAFPATQSASSDANTLDDYEEGTWTPQNSSGSNLPLNNTAGYIKIGKLVFINADINQLNQSSVYNLPFVSASTGYPGVVSVGYNSSYTTSPVTGIFSGNTTTLSLYYNGSTGITPTNGRFIIAGCYTASA